MSRRSVLHHALMFSAYVTRQIAGVLKRIAIVGYLLFLLAVPIAMTNFESLFTLASQAAATILDTPDILSREKAKTSDVEARLKVVIAEGEVQRKEIEAFRKLLLQKEAALAAEKAAATEARLAASKTADERDLAALRAAKAEQVRYRTKDVLLRDAVADTSQRAATRIKTMVGTDISSMAGQAIPYVGVAAIVASTSYVAFESCQMMKDLYELDIAFNPENAIDTTEVCGMRVPTADEIWETVKSTSSSVGSALWEFVPDFQWQAGFDILMDDVSGLLGSETGP